MYSLAGTHWAAVFAGVNASRGLTRASLCTMPQRPHLGLKTSRSQVQAYCAYMRANSNTGGGVAARGVLSLERFVSVLDHDPARCVCLILRCQLCYRGSLQLYIEELEIRGAGML